MAAQTCAFGADATCVALPDGHIPPYTHTHVFSMCVCCILRSLFTCIFLLAASAVRLLDILDCFLGTFRKQVFVTLCLFDWISRERMAAVLPHFTGGSRIIQGCNDVLKSVVLGSHDNLMKIMVQNIVNLQNIPPLLLSYI